MKYNEALNQNAGQVLINMMIKAEKIKYERLVYNMKKAKRK